MMPERGMGLHLVQGLLILVGLLLGALGGVSVVLASGQVPWPGSSTSVLVRLVPLPGVDVAEAQLASNGLATAITPDRLLERWADVIVREHAEQDGPLAALYETEDIAQLKVALRGAISEGPSVDDAEIRLTLGGFRTAGDARLAAVQAGEALEGLAAEFRREFLMARQPVLQSASGVEWSLLDLGVVPAIVAEGATKLQHPRRWYLAAGVGAVLGALLMLLALRPHVQMPNHLHALATVSHALGVEVIGAIPFSRSLSGHTGPRLFGAEEDAAVQESLEVLLTNFRFAAPQGDLRTVCFVSAVPGEGAATLALNFAAAHAARGMRVALHGVAQVELDRPTLPATLHIAEDALSEETSPGEIEAAMTVAVGGAVLATPATRALAARADVVVLVIDTAVTGRALALRALRLLQNTGAPVAGVVLNRVRRGGLRRAFLRRAAARAHQEYGLSG